MKSANYYDILEISPSASAEVIRAAYRSLSRKHHPDANPDSDETKHFKRVQKELLANVVFRESLSGDDFGLNCTGL
jgi:DnaJ-class molecular chaperone